MATVDPYTKHQLERDWKGRDNNYPNPFFDMANNFIPKNIKSLFKYCHSFYHTDPFLSNVIRKLTEYPITEILYKNNTDTETRNKYNKILHDKLQIKTTLIEVGLDYYTYGNCIISMFMIHKRYLKDPDDGNLIPIEKAEYKFKNFKFYMHKKGWSHEKEVEVVDQPVKSIEGLRLVRWNPENVDIKYNPLTGNRRYFYDIPNHIKNAIKRGDKEVLEDTPLLFLESLKKSQRIELDKEHLYHFKRPGLAEADMGWGKPMILAAIKKIYYLQTLQRGNEAIANEHIVPKKAISPANTATLDPLTQLNLPKWKGEIQDQIKKWRRDPNHIGVFPIPIGYQELGGNAKALLLTPEMKFLEEVIINSLGVPLEFIKGGTSWTGSSISLRIVENMFLTYRGMLEDFLNHFIVKVLVRHLKFPHVQLKFKQFKMSDDAQAKQIMLQLSELGKISDPKLLDEFGYSYEEMLQEHKQVASGREELMKAQTLAKAKSEGEAFVLQQKYEVRAKLEQEKEYMSQRILTFQKELQKEYGAIPPNFIDMIEQLAIQIVYLPPEQQLAEIDKLAKTKPSTHALVMERIQLYQENGLLPKPPGSMRGDGNPNVKEEPPNKKSPGSREEDKVKVRDKEKTKGQTRGAL